MKRPAVTQTCILMVIALMVSAGAQAASVAFRVTLDAKRFSTPYTGRLYVVLAPDNGLEPRLNVGDWFNPPQIVAVDVENLAPGVSVVIDGAAISYPAEASEIAPGTYAIQAFGRLNPDTSDAGKGAGDPISAPATVTLADGEMPATLDLLLDRDVESEPFEETDRIKLFEMVSPSLSAFHGREVVMRAGVRLPRDWRDEPTASYPIVYWITGFGGDHTGIDGIDRMTSRIPGADDCLIVVPDASCRWGHSAFVDSATNGPRGSALVDELIPALEARFHGPRDAVKRAVGGGSSGGWASLWLQIAYPDTFGSCWSHCPDPVDFRDFQQIDLYRPGSNMYRDENGDPRPIARRGERVIMTYEEFVRMESAMGIGGQIGSFEATFSPRDPDGNPLRLFDRTTGVVDTAVARTWESFDICLRLKREWPTLGPKLAGKLHVYAGGLDTFYLEGAAKLLQETLTALGSDAEVLIVDGMPHSTYPAGIRKMFQSLTSEADVIDPAGAIPEQTQ